MDPNATIRTNAAGLAAAGASTASMESIDTMPAGAELDALVAVKVMGWTRLGDHVDGLVVHRMYRTPQGMETSYPPAYSRVIGVAWDVVERMTSLGWLAASVQLRVQGHGSPAGWECRFIRNPRQPSGRVDGAIADTAPIAICRAALKAVADA